MARKLIKIEDARILPGSFRNFSGGEDKFHKGGSDNRYFNVELPEQLAKMMITDGFNIKQKEYDGDISYYTKVKVSYDKFPPDVYKFVDGKRVSLTEDTIKDLDRIQIKTCDLELSPYSWEMNGRSGITLYLKRAYIEQELDEFDRKWGATSSDGASGDSDDASGDSDDLEELPFI